MAYIIAIDGPAGTGKSSAARALALELGLLYVDTGAIYRALAYEALKQQIPVDDPGALAQVAGKIDLKMSLHEQNGQQVLLGGKDVTKDIRTETMSQMASTISQYGPVRAALLGLQRNLALNAKKGAVLEGRDIGTVVFPQANIKFFLTASAQIRAKRRYDQLLALGQSPDFDEILKSVKLRDERDANRLEAPMKPAPDAILLDTTGLSLFETIEALKSAILKKGF